jgi:hypothetical protein
MVQLLGKLAVKLALWLLQHPDVVKQVVQEVHDAKAGT